MNSVLTLESLLQQFIAVQGERCDLKVAYQLGELLEYVAAGRTRAEIEARTYHMGAEPTPGRGYDDRLTSRLGCGENTAYKYLSLPEHRGGIRHRRLGKKYHVTERAIREWEGDPILQQAT